jgi:polyisoprenoid-binding protein YceI
MKKTFIYAAILGLFSVPFVSNAEPIHYKIDTVHSGISFKIRHIVSNTPGDFTDFTGSVVFDEANPANSSAEATIQVSSVDTRNEKRDGHLQSEDFFNAAQFPALTFKSTNWAKVDDTHYKVTGDLSFAGQSHPVTLDVTYLGQYDNNGTLVGGWEGTTTIKRSDWGMSYGTPAVGDEVEIELNIAGESK